MNGRECRRGGRSEGEGREKEAEGREGTEVRRGEERGREAERGRQVLHTYSMHVHVHTTEIHE